MSVALTRLEMIVNELKKNDEFDALSKFRIKEPYILMEINKGTNWEIINIYLERQDSHCELVVEMNEKQLNLWRQSRFLLAKNETRFSISEGVDGFMSYICLHFDSIAKVFVSIYFNEINMPKTYHFIKNNNFTINTDTRIYKNKVK